MRLKLQMRLNRLLFLVGLAVYVLFLTQAFLEAYDRETLDKNVWKPSLSHEEKDYAHLFKEVTQPVVVWWEPLGGGAYRDGRVRQCNQLSCYFTEDRQFRHHPRIKAFMFYGSSVNFTDLPLPRNRSLLWALLHEESPRNNPELNHLAALSLFNLTATCSRHSDYPLTTQYLGSLDDLTDLKYFLPVESKNKLQEEEDLAPVMYLQSDCSTPLDRDSYVEELMKHIKVDSYGTCLHNKDLPLNLQPPHSLDTMMAEDMLHLVAKYKFALSIENGVCHDYITEKLWRPLISGSVPVYIGSPSVSDWLPNNKSAVLGGEFASPRDLAEYLHQLNSNNDEYNEFLSHKHKSAVSNRLLIQTMKEREWADNPESEKDNFIDAFACHVCEKAHTSSVPSVATEKHYLCPMPLSILSKAPNTSNFWLDSWFYGRCKAKATRSFVDSKTEHFTQEDYDKVLRDLIVKGKCQYSKENDERSLK